MTPVPIYLATQRTRQKQYKFWVLLSIKVVVKYNAQKSLPFNEMSCHFSFTLSIYFHIQFWPSIKIHKLKIALLNCMFFYIYTHARTCSTTLTIWCFIKYNLSSNSWKIEGLLHISEIPFNLFCAENLRNTNYKVFAEKKTLNSSGCDQM